MFDENAKRQAFEKLPAEERDLRTLFYGLWKGERRPERSTGAWNDVDRQLMVSRVMGLHGAPVAHVFTIAGSPPHGILLARYGYNDLDDVVHFLGSIGKGLIKSEIVKQTPSLDPIALVRAFLRCRGDDMDAARGALMRIAALAASAEPQAKDKIFALAKSTLETLEERPFSLPAVTRTGG